MDEHAKELLPLATWLIVVLLGALVALAKWQGAQILKRMDAQDKTMSSIKELLASETQKIRDMINAHAVEIRSLNEWRSFVQDRLNSGRRHTDDRPD